MMRAEVKYQSGTPTGEKKKKKKKKTPKKKEL